MVLTVLVVASFVLALVFVIRYATRNFLSRPSGRAVMLLALGATLTLGLSTWRILIGPTPEPVRYVVFSLIPAAFLYLNIALTQTRRRADRREREKENAR